jgi:hypothetical protein
MGGILRLTDRVLKDPGHSQLVSERHATPIVVGATATSCGYLGRLLPLSSDTFCDVAALHESPEGLRCGDWRLFRQLGWSVLR